MGVSQKCKNDLHAYFSKKQKDGVKLDLSYGDILLVHQNKRLPFVSVGPLLVIFTFMARLTHQMDGKEKAEKEQK